MFVEFIGGSVRVEKTLIDWQRVVRRALQDLKERSIESVDGDQAILEAHPSCPAECCVCCPTSHSGAFHSVFAPELCRTEGCHRELVIHFVKTPTFCNEAGLAGVSGTASWQERHINHHRKGAPGLYEH